MSNEKVFYCKTEVVTALIYLLKMSFQSFEEKNINIANNYTR